MLRLSGYRCVIFDMAEVPLLDITGADILEESIELLQGKGVDVLLARPSPSVRPTVATSGSVKIPAGIAR